MLSKVGASGELKLRFYPNASTRDASTSLSMTFYTGYGYPLFLQIKRPRPAPQFPFP
jgi:hypothetical protein